MKYMFEWNINIECCDDCPMIQKNDICPDWCGADLQNYRDLTKEEVKTQKPNWCTLKKVGE